MVILKCGHGIGITSKQKDRPARWLLLNGQESYSVLLTALVRSAAHFGARREPQKDSCGSSARKMQFSLGWNRAGAQTPASISSSRLQDRNFTQRGPRKSIEDDFMGKRRNCGVNEHLCFLHRCERYAASDDEVYNCALYSKGCGTLRLSCRS